MIPEEVAKAVKASWGSRFAIIRTSWPVMSVSRVALEHIPRRRSVHYPYYALVRQSIQPALRDFTIARPGNAERIVNADELSDHLTRGFTLKVQRLEYFSLDVFDVVTELEKLTSTFVTSFAFVTPPESQALAYHRDASHVLVHQVEGYKSWHLWEPFDLPKSKAGLVDNPEGTLHEFVLGPGDYLYFPHGWVHAAFTNGSGGSTHVTYTMSSYSPEQLLGAVEFVEEHDRGTAEILIESCRYGLGAFQ